MRLLNTETQELETFIGNSTPEYAILSHTWDKDEITFDDMLLASDDIKKRKGYEKIHRTCVQSQEDGIRYAWIDTCCIDKRSSAELSEAINSMYAWYRAAAVCYVHLADVSEDCPQLVERGTARESTRLFDGQSQRLGTQCVERTETYVFDPHHLQRQEAAHTVDWVSRLYTCKWFTRGWTLQELIAPQRMMFFGSAWNFIGFRDELLNTISDITRIDIPVLQHRCDVSQMSIAKRMSWAARRQTTRPEDGAYCLLGLFGVNIALLYGEGIQKAFRRLQEELLKVSSDHTIFVWNTSSNRPLASMDTLEPDSILATSPDDFFGFSDISPFEGHSLSTSLEMTNVGLRITLPLLPCHADSGLRPLGHFIGILNCRYEDDLTKIIGIRLSCEDPESGIFSVVRYTKGGTSNASTRTTYIGVDEVRSATWRSILITTRTFEYGNLSLGTSIWIRQCPWDVCEGYPPSQWNLRSRVMNRYKTSTVGNNIQLGGVAFETDGPRRLFFCFAIMPAGSSNITFGFRYQDKEDLREVYERFHSLLLQEESELRSVTLPIAANFVANETSEVNMQLAYEVIMGENVLVIDVEIAQVQSTEEEGIRCSDDLIHSSRFGVSEVGAVVQYLAPLHFFERTDEGAPPDNEAMPIASMSP